MRVLLVVTHLLGAGHLTRTAALGRALAAAGHAVTLATGGRPAPLVDAAGLALAQLPPVQGRVDDLRTLRDPAGEPASPAYLAHRRERLLETLRATMPDVLVTELFPFGRRSLGPEFRALLDAATALPSRPAIVASVRDILAPPSTEAKREEAEALLARSYDGVLVHGDPRLVTLDRTWPLSPAATRLLHYTGYVDAGPPDPTRPEGGRTDEILVSGGSSAAALPLYRAALGAARLVPDRPWRILVGAGVSAAERAALAADAPDHVAVETARPDFRDLMRRAALFVGQAGYNTALDLVAAGPRAVLVPFEAGGETEQRVRAGHLAAAGLGTLLPEAELSAASLAAAVAQSSAGPPPPPMAIERDGASRSAEILAAIRARTVADRGRA